MANDRIPQLAKELRKLKDKKDKLEAQIKALNEQIGEIETKTLPQIMESQEVDSLKVAGVGTVYLSQEVYTSVLADDRPKLFSWLREKGHGALVVDWVFPNTLKAFAKEQLTNGKTLPDVLKATFIPTAKLRRK